MHENTRKLERYEQLPSVAYIRAIRKVIHESPFTKTHRLGYVGTDLFAGPDRTTLFLE